jgi:hypothetical protein
MSKIEVDTIAPQSGTTVTLGESGDTVNIPSGVTITNNGTQTGFGRTGTVDWQSTVKTASFTAVNGEGYFVNTTSSAVTMTLPAGSAGAIVSVKDYASTFNTNNLTITPNGSEKIGGLAESVTVSEDGIALTLIYIDSTQGWLVTSSGLQSEAPASTYDVDFLVIAGGGSGGGYGGWGGGGGAGGYRNSYNSETSGGGGSSETSLALTPGTTYTITVGAGGTGVNSTTVQGNDGNDSSISGSDITTITSNGGGGGGLGTNSDATPTLRNARDGGSGGGGGFYTPKTGTGGSGTANQGFAGGASSAFSPDGASGGGGGAGEAGNTDGTAQGGDGLSSSITGSAVTRGGGGGGINSASPAAGGDGGGGAGQANATANTGGGGGGANGGGSGDGGSGVVILRMATARYSGTTTGSPTVTTDGTDTILTFNASGSYTA